MTDRLRAKRWQNFRRRADYAPETVYRHRTHGWEYIPIHPFGDEPEILAQLHLRPESCLSVDAWWGIDGDATLLEASVVDLTTPPLRARLFSKARDSEEGWTYLVAVFDRPFITRVAFEDAMSRFADAGFPRRPLDADIDAP